jgi:hypothetical protein
MAQKVGVPGDKNAKYRALEPPVADNNHHSFPEICKTDNTDRLKASTQKRYESLDLKESQSHRLRQLSQVSED